MFRLKKWLPAAMGLAVAVALTAAAPARAGFTLTLEESGFSPQSFNLTSGQLNTVGPVTIGDYQVTVTARDSAPGLDPVFGGALVSQNTFTVTSNGPGTAPLQITVQDDTFSSSNYSGVSNVSLQNSLSTTLLSSGTVTAHGFLNGGVTDDISLTGPTLSGNVANSKLVPGPGGSTFTLGNFASVAFTGTGTQQANFTVTTLAPVPEPATMMAAFTALPFLGLGAWLRRRKLAI